MFIDFINNIFLWNIYREFFKIQPTLWFNWCLTDFFILHGDRFETFAAAIASSSMNIPTVQLEAGDITNGGTYDDSARHAISRLSHLLFTTNEESKKRLIKYGEEKWRIKNFGSTTFEKLLKNHQIKIRRYISADYIKSFFGEDETELSVMANKLNNGLNKNEVQLVSKSIENKGFFERFFQLFS